MYKVVCERHTPHRGERPRTALHIDVKAQKQAR